MIKQLRVGEGVSQEELALMADISVRTLQRVESGEQAQSRDGAIIGVCAGGLTRYH